MKNIRNRVLQAMVLFMAVSQLITPIFSRFDKQDAFTQAEIIPAGYTFGIWGVITLLGFIYGVYQFLPARRNAGLHRRLGRTLVLIYLLFSVWIFAADRNWLVVTLLVFLLMFGLLTIGFWEVVANKQELTTFERFALEAQLALYTGWTTVAIYANMAACLQGYGVLVPHTQTGTLIQWVLLLGALANGLFLIRRFQYNIFYACTILWAFAGIYVGLREKSGNWILQWTVVGGVVVIFGLLTGRLMRGRIKQDGAI